MRSDEEVIQMLNRHPGKYGIESIVDKKAFVERVLKYRDEAVKPTIGLINEI